MINVFTVLLQILVTFMASFLFGIERQKMHKPVGFSTYTFVSLGACTLALTAMNLMPENPLPLLSAVVTGIGFLGAGALIKSGEKIWGFSSAATIWLFAIFGILIGVGEYSIAIIVYILIWVTTIYDMNLEKRGLGLYKLKMIITTNKIISEQEIRNILIVATKSYKLIEIEVYKKDNKMVISYYVEGNKEEINKLPRKLYEKDWFDHCKIE